MDTTTPHASPVVDRSALAGPALAAGATAASIGLVAVVDPNVAGRYPVCPSITLFGVFCPFCGGLRGVHALTEGDLPAMVSSNLLLPVILVLGAWAWLSWTTQAVGMRRGLPPPALSSRTWLVLAAATLLYGVLRNLSGTPFEALAP